MQRNTDPLLTLSYTIEPKLFEDCVVTLGRPMKKKNMPRTVVIGGIFTASSLGFLSYLLLYLHQSDTLLTVLSLLLMAMGIYNLAYYPLFFERQMRWRASSRFRKSVYMRQPVHLYFYDDYIEEVLPQKTTRIQWVAVPGVLRENKFYMLRLSADNGLIIPRESLSAQQARDLEAILAQKPFK